ncbi:MAG: hypothetical protein E4G89_06345 [Methanothrix sp.]|nr:MAG: hypothetical protein E4G89_06345 [Methanothrix sp.]
MAFDAPKSIIVTLGLIVGGLRIFELVVYQVNVLLFDEWRARRSGREYSLRGYKWLFVLLLHNYFELVFWFVASLFAFEDRAYLTMG